MSEQTATLALRVDSNEAIKSLEKFSAKTTELGQLAQKAGKVVAGMFAVKTIAGIGKDLLMTASDMQEAGGKFRAVFKHMGDDAQKCADELVNAFGYSKMMASQSLSTMSDIFTKAGLSISDSLNYSHEIHKVAADLAAFTNCEGGLARATEALQAVMLGYGARAQQLGVVIYETDVKTKMAQEAQEGLTFATEAAAQAHARYSLILDRTVNAQGQVAREGDNLASRLTALDSAIANLKESFGSALIDPATKGVNAIIKLSDAASALPEPTKKLLLFAAAGTSITLAVSPLVMALKTYFAAQKMAAATTALATAAKKEDSASATENAATTAADSAAHDALTASSSAASAALQAESSTLELNNSANETNTERVAATTEARNASILAINERTNAINAETEALLRNADANNPKGLGGSVGSGNPFKPAGGGAFDSPFEYDPEIIKGYKREKDEWDDAYGGMIPDDVADKVFEERERRKSEWYKKELERRAEIERKIQEKKDRKLQKAANKAKLRNWKLNQRGVEDKPREATGRLADLWREGRSRLANPGGKKPTKLQRYLLDNYHYDAPDSGDLRKVIGDFSTQRGATKQRRRVALESLRTARSAGLAADRSSLLDYAGGGRLMGAARKIVGNKRGPVANIAKQAADVFGKFGKLPIFGKITGIFTKLAKPLGWIGARSSTLLATASRFVPFLGRFAGAFGALGAIGGPVTAVIMGTVGALKALKEAPKALVKWKYEWKDKLAELGSLSVEWIKAGMKKGADAVVAAAGWTKDLVVDGLLGAGSFLVGLTGRETAFERQYKLDKQQQALADRKKSVQDAEEEALKREQHLLDLRNSVVDSRNQTAKNTDRDYLKEKASDSFKLYEAKIALGKTEAQQNAKEKEINEIYDGVWRLDKKLVAAEDKIGETNQEIVAINVGKKKTESGRELNDAEKEKALTQARADNATAVNERNEIDKQISGLVAKAETIQKEMGPLNETWAEQRRAVLELTDAVEAKNREFQAASDAVTKQLTQQEEALKDYNLSVAVDMAQTKADEADARKKILARTNEKISEAQAAGEAANDKTKRIDDVFKFLTKESSAFFTAGVGSVVGANKNVSDNVEEQSAKDKDDIAAISGALSVFSRSAIGDSKVLKDFALSVRPDVEGKTELDDLGATEIMRKGKVEEFYQALLAAQEEEWRNIDGLAKERDALLAKAQELPALLKERNSESAEIKETEKEIQARANERLEADEKRTERQQEANKSVWETQRNEAFSRRLNAASSNPEKMALLSYRHALSGAEANAEIGGLSAKISEFDEEIKSLDERDAKGELNEEERARRDKLVEKREEAEGKRNSVYAEAINERIGIENQAKSVAENWAQEQANKYKENQQRFAQAQKEDQKGISGQSAIKAGSSQAFAMTSRIYDQGTKTTQKSVEKIEETTKRMVEYLSRYLMSNSQGFALDFNG